MTALAASIVTAGYTRAPILRDVNIAVAAGEFVAVFGANGAGKTTLLRAISGVLPVCKGSVQLDGREVMTQAPWTRVRFGLAHVPEGRHVFRAMTVDDNLSIGGLTVSSREGVNKARVYELFPRLEERKRQLAGSMSGGEQQMLAVGRALMAEPKVLLVDEMSAGLSPLVTQQLVEGLTRVNAAGTGILLVEQSPHYIAGVIDRAVVLAQGRVVAAGTLESLGGTEGLAAAYLGAS